MLKLKKSKNISQNIITYLLHINLIYFIFMWFIAYLFNFLHINISVSFKIFLYNLQKDLKVLLCFYVSKIQFL